MMDTMALAIYSSTICNNAVPTRTIIIITKATKWGISLADSRISKALTVYSFHFVIKMPFSYLSLFFRVSNLGIFLLPAH